MGQGGWHKKQSAGIANSSKAKDAAGPCVVENAPLIGDSPKWTLQDDNLVTWLPYDSIEATWHFRTACCMCWVEVWQFLVCGAWQVIFNDKNSWANRQNHHPACITYVAWLQLSIAGAVVLLPYVLSQAGVTTSGFGGCRRGCRKPNVGAVSQLRG